MRKPVATFWRPVTEGTAYVRCDLPARHLPGNVTRLTRESLVEGFYGTPMVVGQEAPVCVWSGPGSKTEGRIMESFRAIGTPAFVDVDDVYVFRNRAVENGTWAMELSKDPHLADRRNVEAHQLIIRNQASGVICSTERLADVYRRFHENVHVCRNCVDPRDWPEDPFKLKPKDGIFRVGIASSDPDRLHRVKAALEWASRQRNVEVFVMGARVPEWEFPYEWIPWHEDLARYRFDLLSLDVGLAPVEWGVEWSKYHSDLKLLEYSLAGAASIVTDADPYHAWVDGPVRVAGNEKGFREHLEELIAHPARARELAQAARELVLQTRTIEQHVDEWRRALASADD